jgi:hypothetical protein
MPPLLAFGLGVLLSEIMQWGLWLVGHPAQKGEPMRPHLAGYFRDGLAHFVLAWSVCGMVGLLWALGGMDWVVSFLPDAMTEAWADTGVPYTPQVGATLGFAIDFAADKIAWAFRARLGSAPSAVPVPPTPPAGGGQ